MKTIDFHGRPPALADALVAHLAADEDPLPAVVSTALANFVTLVLGTYPAAAPLHLFIAATTTSFNFHISTLNNFVE